MQNNRKSRLALITAWAAVFCWMGLLFYLSSQMSAQSDALSRGVAQWLSGVRAGIFPGFAPHSLQANTMVRKSAHFLSYLVLSLLVMNALRKSGVQGARGALMALGLCVLYAAGDEVHQLLVPGRNGQIKDVLLDSAGAVAGMALHRLFGCPGPGKD